MTKKQVIAFDMVGTLLDLSALDPRFLASFGRSDLRKEWFSEVLKLALSITAAGAYESFPDITDAALKVIEDRYQQELSSSQRKQILQGLRELPAFPDVKPALQALKSHDNELIVLTNSGKKSAKEALESAKLAHLFDGVLSSEDVKRLKPAPEPYLMAAKKSGVQPPGLLLVAAHSWDIRGALRVGFQAAFVRRPEQVLDELTPKPEFIVADMAELAERLKR